MSENKKDNLKYALAYVPLFAFILFFVEKNISDEYKKHITYGMVLFGLYVVISIVLNLLLLGIFIPLLLLFYIIISGILGYKAYNGEEVDVEVLDNISDTIKEKMDK